IRGEPRNECAAARFAEDQPVPFEYQQRLAHRRPAHTKFADDPRLDQALARPHLPGEDRILNTMDDPVPKPEAADLAQLQGIPLSHRGSFLLCLHCLTTDCRQFMLRVSSLSNPAGGETENRAPVVRP